MKKFITEISLVPNKKDASIIDDGAIIIRLIDEGGGAFLEIISLDGAKISLDFSEIDEFFAACKSLDGQNDE